MAKFMCVILSLVFLAIGILGLIGVSMFTSNMAYVNIGEIVLGGLGLLVGIFARHGGKNGQQRRQDNQQTKQNNQQVKQNYDQQRKDNDQLRKENEQKTKENNQHKQENLDQQQKEIDRQRKENR